MDDLRGWTTTTKVGDALQVLPTIDDDHYDAVVTDPPYSSGGQFRGDRANTNTSEKYQSTGVGTVLPDFEGDTRDQRAYGYWSTLWMMDARRVVRPGGWLMVFTDWRQLPTTVDAVQAAGWLWRGIVTWCKPGARPIPNRFASATEFVVVATNGHHGLEYDGAAYPLNYFETTAPSDRVHMTQKPVDLMQHLLSVLPAESRILDPFMGTGTTLEAAQSMGHVCDGIDISSEWIDYAEARTAQGSLL